MNKRKIHNKNNLSKKSKTDFAIKKVQDDADDREIKLMEKRLGLSKKNKNKNAFYSDGLGDILEFIEEREKNGGLNYKDFDDDKPEEVAQSEFQPKLSSKWISKRVEENKNKIENKKNDTFLESESNDENGFFDEEEDGSVGTNDENDNKFDEEFDDELDEEFDEEFDKELNKEFDEELEQEFNDEFDEEYNEKKIRIKSDKDNFLSKKNDLKKDNSEYKKNEDVVTESKTKKYKEDIYGRIIGPNGEIIKEKSNDIVLYEDNSAEENLTKKIRGLFNRLALKTMPFVTEQIENLFQKHSNNLISKCLLNCIDQLIIKNTIIASQKLCTEIVMLISVLHSHIGEEISGNVLHQLIIRFEKVIKFLENDENDICNREIENLSLLICVFYGVNIISDEVIYDIMNKLVLIFNAKTIELILFYLKLVGYLLRKDNPIAMKELIINVQKKAASFNKELVSEKKVIFMLDALISIKNNNTLKIDLSDIKGITPIDKQQIRNDIKKLFKDLNVSCLRGKYNEILRSNRWFVQSGELLEQSIKRKIEKQKVAVPTLNEKLCKKLQLTTPLRKLIFNTLITSEDYLECSQNLISIAKKQHFEVINVCLHVGLSEKVFNPFYVHLLRYLGHIDRNYKRGIIFILKEKLANLDNLNNLQQNNLSKIIPELIKMHIVTLAIFNAIDFKDMNDLYKNFMISILNEIFNVELKQLKEIFKKLNKKDTLNISIKLFVNIFMNQECKNKLKVIKNGLISDTIF